jgi:P27 family predicted phage terminase small subunit
MGARGRKSASEIAMPPPPVRLVESTLPVELPAAPLHLSPATQDWWRQIVADYDLEVHHLKLLESACDAWDRMTTARATVLRDGLMVEGDRGPKQHPCVGIERDARIAFARLIRELDLDSPVPAPGPYHPPPALRSNRRR